MSADGEDDPFADEVDSVSAHSMGGGNATFVCFCVPLVVTDTP